MDAPRLTRRSLLAGTAGTMVGGALGPARALASLQAPRSLESTPRPRLTNRWLGGLPPEGKTIRLASPADLVGLEWHAEPHAQIWLRFRLSDGAWSSWVPAGPRGHAPEGGPTAGRTVGEPLWTGGTTAVQARAAAPLAGVRLHLVDVSGGAGSRSLAGSPAAMAAALPLATPVLEAGAGQPPIIARRAWAQGVSRPRGTPEYGAVRMAFVHHTENPNGYAPAEVPAMLRAIYAFHRYVNGWNDIGYNFVLDLYGRIFEARAGGIEEPVVGAQAGGYNTVSTGVAVLGSFSAVPISPAARRALEALLAWKLSLHGVPAEGTLTVRVNPAGASYSRFPANARVPLPRIAGHRDGDATECPGDVLYGELPAIRRGVRRLSPNPSSATIALTAAPLGPSGPGTPPTPGGQAAAPADEPTPQTPAGAQPEMLSGTLAVLDGTPIGGAPVVLQARAVSRKGEIVRELPVAETTTDAAGRWSLLATPAAGGEGEMWLRALYPGASGTGACVSEPLRVPAALSLTTAPAPAAGTGPTG